MVCPTPQVYHYQFQESGFIPGDSLSLFGNFTDTLSIDLSYFYGSASKPTYINSTDPLKRATITPADGHGISIYDFPERPAKGFDLRISDLNIVGNGQLSSKGECDDAYGCGAG